MHKLKILIISLTLSMVWVASALAKQDQVSYDSKIIKSVVDDVLLQYQVHKGQSEFIQAELVGDEAVFTRFLMEQRHQGVVTPEEMNKLRYVMDSGKIFWESMSDKKSGTIDLLLFMQQNFEVDQSEDRNPILVGRFLVGFFFSCVGHAAHCDIICGTMCSCGIYSCTSQCGLFSGWKCNVTCATCPDENLTMNTLSNPFYFPNSGIWASWTDLTSLEVLDPH